jgi:hypothetical protein
MVSSFPKKKRFVLFGANLFFLENCFISQLFLNLRRKVSYWGG